MRRPRFFTRQQLHSSATITLEADPSRHIARTLRMEPGDVLYVFDGEGREAEARIADARRDAVTVALGEVERIDRESPLAITLAVAVSRGDRMDTVVQKATELGVSHLWPLLSERTGVRLDEKRWQRKLSHWQGVAISACEQCGRNTLPTIEPPAPLGHVLTRRSTPDDASLKLVLHPTGDSPSLPTACTSLVLLVGPEGGFSESEVHAAINADYQPLQLGPRILRTETAPLAAIAVAQARWGDLNL